MRKWHLGRRCQLLIRIRASRGGFGLRSFEQLLHGMNREHSEFLPHPGNGQHPGPSPAPQSRCERAERHARPRTAGPEPGGAPRAPPDPHCTQRPATGAPASQQRQNNAEELSNSGRCLTALEKDAETCFSVCSAATAVTSFLPFIYWFAILCGRWLILS